MTAPIPASSLAAFACHPAQSRGRLRPEPESATRTCFQRDRDRVVHSGAFRKLQYKTQVFVAHEGDYYRTRLTHTIEVAQIARSICRQLGLNEDLAEALALAHDLGHTCYGHAGEDALAAAMAPYGGFDHNEQTFRILTSLERRYADFDGLNLTWESLEGVVKHNGPLTGPLAAPLGPGEDPPASIAAYEAQADLDLGRFAGAEAQVAALADDIAYNNHDIDDGLRAGLFAVEDLHVVPLVGEVFQAVAARHPGLDQPRLVHESVRRLIDHMVTDLLATSRARLAAGAPKSADEVRDQGRPMIAFSEDLRAIDKALRAFLFERMYRHERVNRMTDRSKRIVRELFDRYMTDPAALPPEWQQAADGLDSKERARLVADYIAGMTDRYALSAHERLCGGLPG